MNSNSIAYGGEISSGAIGAKFGLGYKESWIDITYSNVFDSSDNEHNSLVTPWDGTPLFTNTLTSSNLFSSNYAKGLSSTGGYISGTQGMRLSYKQKYKFISLKGVKSILTYARFENSNFSKAQEDLNAIVGYTFEKLTISLKGVWVKNSASNSSGDTSASISQLDRLKQYRVIVNYKF